MDGECSKKGGAQGLFGNKAANLRVIWIHLKGPSGEGKGGGGG